MCTQNILQDKKIHIKHTKNICLSRKEGGADKKGIDKSINQKGTLHELGVINSALCTSSPKWKSKVDSKEMLSSPFYR